MEERSRQQMLEEILKRFCEMRTLHYEVIKDLLLQLKSITKTKGDEEDSLLFIVRLTNRELKKCKRERTDVDKTKRLRAVLSSIINDLTTHIKIYFPAIDSGNLSALNP